MMTKDEIKAMIAETIQTNNKKAITAQSLANVLTTMAENSGEGGGLKYSEERTIYGLEEMTEEQKAYNAETYNKIMNSEAVTINIGGMFPPYSTAYPADGSEPTVELSISFNFSGYEVTLNVHLHSDGSTDAIVVEGRYILVSEDDTYETLASTLETIGIMAGYTGNPIWISSQWGEGYNTRIMFFGIDSVRYIIIEFTDSEGVRHAVYADSESNKVSYTRQGGATIYVNVSETDTTYTRLNKYLFPAKKYEYADIISFTVEVLNEGYVGDPDYEYRPLSYGRHFTNGFVDYYTITIYRNNTFETWQITADGTSTLVTA